MNTETLLEESNMHILAERIERIWRRGRPKLMRLYDETKQTEARTHEAARRCTSTALDLQQMGLARDQANSLAMYEWVYLPDIEEGDRPRILAAMENSSTGVHGSMAGV